MKKSTARSIALAKRGARNFVTGRPLCVSFEITYNCNARCKHCHLGVPPKEEVRADPQQYGEVCRELEPVVGQISGGEPLLRRDVEDVVRAVRDERGLPFIVLTTNGALLSRDKWAGLREAGVDEFSLSLDYPDERHDEFRGIPGLFGRIRDLAGQLKGVRKSGITLSCVLQRDNFREMVRLAELARSWNLGMNFSSYTWLRTKDKGYMIPQEEIPELKDMIARLKAYKKAHGTVFTSDYVLDKIPEYFAAGSFPDCRATERFLVVNPDATLSPCGLIIRDYRSRREMRKDFLKTNTCTFCYTSIRANTEKPARYAVLDSAKRL
jgi:MoaA/NifB/PqqE/SkfB family radical SAM enzyme